jgi:hypothetical protein
VLDSMSHTGRCSNSKGLERIENPEAEIHAFIDAHVRKRIAAKLKGLSPVVSRTQALQAQFNPTSPEGSVHKRT